MFKPNLFSEPRRDEEKEKEDQKKLKAQVFFVEETYPVSDGPRQRIIRGMTNHPKPKSFEDKVKFDLVQIYGCWFATRVASLDYATDTEFTSKAAEKISKSILDVLYRISDPKISYDVPLKPDELIYKSCLVLCGKLKRGNEAKRIFKELKRQGIQPSQVTYGAYTNAMASSGAANLLYTGLSSGGSGAEAGSARTSLELRTGGGNTTSSSGHHNTRSRSIILPKAGSKATIPSPFNTINESDENVSPKIPEKLRPTKPLITVRAFSEGNIEPPNDSPFSEVIERSKTTIEDDNSGNIATIKTHSKNKEQSHENEEEKQTQPTKSSIPKTHSSNTLNEIHDNKSKTSSPSEEKSAETDKGDTAPLLIDYSTLEMDTRQQCKCGYVMSDAEVLANWPEEFLSTEVSCKACNLNSFVPKIHIKCNATRMSVEKHICEQITLDFKVTYFSPAYLRRSMETIVSKYRQRLEDCENLRKFHPNEYWNLLWYFVQRKLDLDWLLEHLDSNKIQISPIIDVELTKFPIDNAELDKQMQVIITHLKARDLKSAMAQWLKNREAAPTKERGHSIWNISLPDAFFSLNVPVLYTKYEDYINDFRDVCSVLQPVLGDRPPDKKAVKYEIIFKHMRPIFPRIQQYSSRLTSDINQP